MISSGIKYEMGDIVLIPFPFTDLTFTKQRPVLVISSDEYNSSKEDFIVCGITSNVENKGYSVEIDNNSLSKGEIPGLSKIKVDKLFTLKQSLAKKKIGKVKNVILKKVKEELDKLIIPF